MKALRLLVLSGLWLAAVSWASARQKGVIDDPDGFANLRADQNADAAVVARVPVGEVFEYEAGEGSEWWRVTLKSGQSGWMHYSRILEHAEMADLKDGDPGDELSLYGQGRGIHYYRLARGAAKGELAAMKGYFSLTDTDGGAGEAHSSYFLSVVHLLGDARWSAFLAGQPLDYRLEVRREYVEAMELRSFEPMGYLQRHFPTTAALLFRKELTEWTSPDGQYAVVKTFSTSEPRDSSKVERSRLVVKGSGDVLADLTPEDRGTGMGREGRVLWSPDSRRFAYFSVDGREAGTVLYQAAGQAKFLKVELPEPELPGRAEDAELKGAKKIYTHVEPLQWDSPQRLQLRRHEYWEGKRLDGSINSIGRTYLITVSVAGGRAKVEIIKVEEH